ncbi:MULTISPECIES: hypothetical protein [Virgibacillus]|uniref:Uncharacterized protein n=1 Tax=Virgibacillus dokdonensis TaxID=302167 RepID=A0A2K9J4M6_9BACI|nr:MULTISPECIES: hypothetical protein [Virgibacillus]AUJ26654.1 hypothetical protein A21D_03620 [Virgibacillus dokdonensis]
MYVQTMLPNMEDFMSIAGLLPTEECLFDALLYIKPQHDAILDK